MSEKLDMSAINLERVSEYESLGAFTRLLAIKLKKTNYLVLGDFMRDMKTEDVDYLCSLVDKALYNEDQKVRSKSIEELLIVSMMLATAEGMPPENDEATKLNLDFFMNAITCISLARKGVINIHYENISFGNDMADLPIASMKED